MCHVVFESSRREMVRDEVLRGPKTWAVESTIIDNTYKEVVVGVMGVLRGPKIWAGTMIENR